MKLITVALVAISLLSSPATFVLGQEDPGPSPTESVGCEPHGDHWHCDGPRLPTGATTTASATPTAADPGPSPTESVGCEPHGDHWHCDGPRLPTSATTTGTVTPTAADPGPSPTESVGCEPHGDHWHCEGPVPTTGGAMANVYKVNQCVGVVGVVVAVMMI
ncbi:hypothetical protein EMPG_11502 [Blastomyces silverae]|uniref:Uncharacterized protein n=1 Tax=Blastomyces silverae TaxID=2060906 RepID=A0A0H1BQF0_9EURO|nr:hypothetical protein EMPG_11502 [Blastomyces silverae]